MVELNLGYSSSLSSDRGCYRLLELPPELLKIIESSNDRSSSWVIKGESNDDAVLCTQDKTYTVRSVVLSNSVLVVTPSPSDAKPGQSSSGKSSDIVIRDELHEVLELVPCVPRLQKLGSLLEGREYDEGHDEDEDEDHDMDGGNESQESERPVKRRRFTYEDARMTLQASDLELAKGLRDRRILILEGDLRPIAHSHLTTILELLLNYLVSLSLSHQAAPVTELASSLEDEHDIKRKVSTQVMAWFGDIDKGMWKMDVNATIKEVGVGILRTFKDDPISEEEFMTKWKTTVGDTFENIPSLELLAGNYLSNPSPNRYPPIPLLTYFPCSALPTEPALRFDRLFLTRSRWKAEDISPFLSDIVVDNKERDKLLLKFARAVTDPTGVWYTARTKARG